MISDRESQGSAAAGHDAVESRVSCGKGIERHAAARALPLPFMKGQVFSSRAAYLTYYIEIILY